MCFWSSYYNLSPWIRDNRGPLSFTGGSDAPYLLHLCPDEEVELAAETQHLQAHLLWTQLNRHKRSLHL